MQTSRSEVNPKGKLLFSKGLYAFVDRHFVVCSIVFYQVFGTMLFAYGVLTGLNGNFTIPQLSGTFQSVWIPLVLFLMICWGSRFSNAHFNPAVTFAFMIRRSNKITVCHGFIYFASQLLGGFIGTAIAWQLNTMTNSAPFVVVFDDYKFVWESFRGEVFGTFLLVFFIMTVSKAETSPCEREAQGYAFVPAILMCARQYSFRLQGLNPGFAINFQLWYCIYQGNWAVWQYVWSTFLGPFVGSGLAVLFFELVYKRFLKIYLTKTQIRLNRISYKNVELY